MSSSADGVRPALATARTALPASTIEPKNPTIERGDGGSGRSRTVTSVITPSVPSAPTTSPTRS